MLHLHTLTLCLFQYEEIPLQAAASRGDLEVAEFLVEKGSDLDAKDEVSGDTCALQCDASASTAHPHSSLLLL